MSTSNQNNNSTTTNQMTFVWNIYSLNISSSIHQKPIKSSEFCFNPTGKPRFHFELYPNGKTEKDRGNTLLHLVESKDKEKLKKAKYNYFVNIKKLSSGTEVQECEPTSFKPSKRNDVVVIPNHLFPSDDVSLNFEISYEKVTPIKCDLDNINEDLNELSSAISKAYDRKSHWDTVLYSRDTPFLIHRPILNVRFPKLEEAIDKTTNTVSIGSKIETVVVEKLLHYMYSGKLDRINIPKSIYDAMATAIYELSGSKSMSLGEPRRIFASTRFKKFNFPLLWKIENFSQLKSNESRNYFFKDNTPPWTWFKIFICFSEENEKGNEDIVLSIERQSCICKTIICRIKVLDLDKTFKHSFDTENMWRMPTFIKKNAVMEHKSKYLSNDKLSIDFDICVSDGTYDSEIDKIDFVPNLENQISQSNIDLKLFQKDMINLLNNPKFSDVTIVTSENTFYAHKFILSARSSVFCRMFEENEKEQISIKDMDTTAVKSMLKFIYCGVVENDLKYIKNTILLYSAASKYEISGLHSKCVQFLKTGLSSENAVDILLAADACCDQDLKQHVNHFICSNHRRIMNSQAWEHVKRKKDLMLSLLERALTLVAAKSK